MDENESKNQAHIILLYFFGRHGLCPYPKSKDEAQFKGLHQWLPPSQPNLETPKPYLTRIMR